MQGSELAYQPALDGLRGVAVLAVLLYHGGVSWAGGGFLGVEAFFVLSGYLITSLLVAEWLKDGTIHLGNFWGRRARRLLPALFALVIVCAVYESVVGVAHAVPDFGADGLSTLLYVGNWHQIWTGNGYFAQAALVSPLQHTWSLAIEEQFYLVWPLAVLAVLTYRRSPGSKTNRLNGLLAVTSIGAVASAIEMIWLYHGGSGLNRVYYGTDTRAQGLLAGATLAVYLAKRAARGAVPSRRDGWAVAGVGVAGAVGLGAAIAQTTGSSGWLYRGGWFAVDIAVVAVIAAATATGTAFSPVRTVLAAWPLRSIGIISYGLYLWHFPLMLWLTSSSTGASGTGLLWLRLGSSLSAAIVSFFVVEQPVRRRRVRGLALGVLTPAAASVSLAAVLVAWSATAAVASIPPTIGLPQGHQTCSLDVGGLIGRQLYHVCPPVKMLIVGDSIGLTLGMQLGFNDQLYGIASTSDAKLGCGFVDSGQSNEYGTGYGPPDAHCPDAFSAWRAEERQLRPQALVVEMGYWDELDWRQGGREVNLGEASFDREVAGRMQAFVKAVAMPHVPIVLLSVPVVDPPPWPDGSPAPQASPARHRIINELLQSLAREYPRTVHYFDLSRFVTPGGRFDAYVDGGICRNSDGVHLYVGAYPNLKPTYCGENLQRALLVYIRKLVLGSVYG